MIPSIRPSFRARLVLWSIAILVVTLAVFDLTLSYAIQLNVTASVDQDLSARAARFASGRWRPPPRVAERLGLPRPGPGEPNPPPEGGGEPLDRPPTMFLSDPDAERAVDFMRPRLLMRDGTMIDGTQNRPPWDPAGIGEANSGSSSFATVVVEGDRVRVLSVPWRYGSEMIGVAQVARPLAEYDRLWHGQQRILLGFLPLCLILAGAGGLFLSSRALRPVQQVTRAAAELGVHDLSRRLPVEGTDELAQLAFHFNQMIARLEAAFEQQRRFTADASHELRTPLARMKLCTSEALSGPQSPAEYRSALQVADRVVDSMSRVTEGLLLLAQADAGQLPLDVRTVELDGLVRDAAELVTRDEMPNLRLDLPETPVLIRADGAHLFRVLVNVLGNAIRHTPLSGTVRVEVAETPDGAWIRVSDTGEGIAPEHLPHLGERFYRVDTARSRQAGGTGLGLAICRSLVEAHGGTLEIRSQLGRGTAVTIHLPLQPVPAAAVPALTASPPAPASHPQIGGGLTSRPAAE